MIPLYLFTIINPVPDTGTPDRHGTIFPQRCGSDVRISSSSPEHASDGSVDTSVRMCLCNDIIFHFPGKKKTPLPKAVSRNGAFCASVSFPLLRRDSNWITHSHDGKFQRDCCCLLPSSYFHFRPLSTKSNRLALVFLLQHTLPTDTDTSWLSDLASVKENPAPESI